MSSISDCIRVVEITRAAEIMTRVETREITHDEAMAELWDGAP